MKNDKNIYNAAIYVRLSKDDGDKEESDSIGNQKDLIKDFLKSKPDIRICSERIDDGYSGVDFNRPGFNKMMEEIRAGNINCVVVKDLSRFGRNYIEAGRYIEKIFPFMGVRFISVNDNYDSSSERSQSDNIVIPFKNLINDAYCRDISIKIRSQLEIKRKKGDFIGSFAVFGYLKSFENKNKLIVDEFASKVVKDIFKWKIEGLNQQGIADKLNSMGVSSPLEYKKSLGLAFTTSFKVNSKSLWTAVAVGRILKNEVYIGVLEQGKKSSPNYKIKERRIKSKNEWIRVENAHEAIVSKADFETVNALLLHDTRIAPTEETVYLFSGLLECADCKQAMVRKTVPAGGKKYIYHICSLNKLDKSCSSHRISDDNLSNAVLLSIQNHIKSIISIERILKFIDTLPLKQEEIQKLDLQIIKKEEEIEKYYQLKVSLYEDFADKVIDKTDYLELKGVYSKRCEEAEKSVVKLKEEITNILNNKGTKNLWIESFKKHKNIEILTREIVVCLIEKICIYENGRIEIKFKYQYDYNSALNFIGNICKVIDIEESSLAQEVM
jgi:site-specific DNA recombinase